MRDLLTLNAYAITLPLVPPNSSVGGCFDIPCPETGSVLRVIASALKGWDHVSVSTRRRCPNWPEMCRIKGLFFHDDECAMQLHVPVADHVNMHPFCLHLFRPHDVPIPRPPGIFVGVKDMTPEQARAMTLEQRRAFLAAAEATLANEGRS